MTLHDAIAALLTEYHLEEWIEVFRDDVKAEAAEMGILSAEHPRIQRFREVCRTLRAAAEAP